jgi:hypothetical protein
MLRRVAVIKTNVSEELGASIIRLARIVVTLKMEVIRSSETFVITGATQRNIPEDAIL